MADLASTLIAIAQDIAGLKDEFPQLAKFSIQNADVEGLTISYAFRTHRPERRAGWTSGVPNPDEDGIWFTIDFHDPNSQAQIHTQPVVPRMIFGKMGVLFLILEGRATKPVAGRIRTLLQSHGIKGAEFE